jgi:mannitol/fructose-specific phosphotransferase system IIA component (Ntr-type)
MPLKKTTIVAAEDDLQILRLLTRNLELEGYVVIAVNDGQTALEQIEAHAPDLALRDIMMPRMDGFTVTQAGARVLRCAHPAPDGPWRGCGQDPRPRSGRRRLPEQALQRRGALGAQ